MVSKAFLCWHFGPVQLKVDALVPELLAEVNSLEEQRVPVGTVSLFQHLVGPVVLRILDIEIICEAEENVMRQNLRTRPVVANPA